MILEGNDEQVVEELEFGFVGLDLRKVVFVECDFVYKNEFKLMLFNG